MKTPWRLLAPVIALGICLAWTGCATFRPGAELKVSLVNVRFAQSTVLETTAIFTVRLQNESPELATINGGVHKFYLDGACIGEGLSNETLSLPRLDSATQDLTVHLRNLTVARKLKPILEQKRFDYRVESTLYLEQDGRRGRVRISNTGHLDLREFQAPPPPAH